MQAQHAPHMPPTLGSPSSLPPNPAAPAQRAAGCPYDYPVANSGRGFFAAAGISMKALPFALYRLAYGSMYTAISIAMAVAALGVGTWLTVSVNRWAGVVLILGTMIPLVLFWLPFVERKTFGVKCAHIAILTELITKGHVGDGRQGLFAYGKQIIATRLGDLTSLWDVHRSVNRTIKQLTRTLDFVDKWLPVDISAIKRVTHRAVGGASRYLDAVILSYGLARGDENLAAPATDGVTYCAQNSRTLVRTALGVVVLETLTVVPLWLVVGVGTIAGVFAAAFSSLGGTLAALQSDARAATDAAPVPFLIAASVGVLVGGLIAMLIIRTVRQSLVEPTLIAMVMLRFHNVVRGQALDASWKKRLEDAGDGIGQLDAIRDRVYKLA